jgi:hypothetical protein
MAETEIDYTRLTNKQLMALKAVDGDLTKLSDKDLLEIRDTLNAKPGPVDRAAKGSAVGSTGNYFATRGANVIGGIMGDLPAAAANVADWLYRKAGIDPASIWGPQGAKVLESFKEASGKQVSGDLQRVTGTTPTNLPGWGGKIVDAGVEGLIGSLVTGGTSTPALMAGVGSGVVSEGGGQVAHEVAPSLEPYVRAGGAALGAVGGAFTPSVVRKVGSVAPAFKAPLTAAGRDKIVGQTMFNVADDPNAAIRNLENYTTGRQAYPTGTPGFNLTAAKASGDDALMGVENALNVPGSGLGLRVNQNNVALTNALNALDNGMDPKLFVAELAKVDAGAAMRAQAALDALPKGVDAATAGQAIQGALRGRFDTLTAARSTAVNPLYAEARNFPDDLRISPVFKAVDDAIANSKGDIQKAMEKAKSLLFDAKGQPDWSARGMMNARAELDDMISKAERAGSSNEVRLLMGIKNEIDNSLSFVPAEQQARQTFAAMSRPLDPFQAEQGAKNVAGVIEQSPYTQAPVVAAERVPATFFRPGDAGAATMKEFLAANGGNPGAIDAMRNFIAGKAREAPDVKDFLLKNRPAIEALDPALARQLEDAAATSSIRQGFTASPAGKFLDQDLDAAMKSTLGAPDSQQRMAALRLAAGGDPAAVQGLQKAIFDDFRRSAQAPVAEGGGVPLMTANGAARWLEANRATVAKALTPEQMAGMEEIVRALKDQGQTARKVAGSDTSRNLATRSILSALVGESRADAAWLDLLRKPLGLVYGTANQQTLDRLMEVMLDPQISAALMKQATPGNARMIEPLLQSIARGTAVPALTAGGRESP